MFSAATPAPSAIHFHPSRIATVAVPSSSSVPTNHMTATRMIAKMRQRTAPMPKPSTIWPKPPQPAPPNAAMITQRKKLAAMTTAPASLPKPSRMPRFVLKSSFLS